MFAQLNNHATNYPGKLITFDGVDGSGKSTAIENLVKHLESCGKKVLVTTQPTPEIRAFRIFKTFIYEPEKREFIDYRALQLYMFGDRLQHIKEVIEPALKDGAFVISDRYIFTMLATFIARGHDPEPWMNGIIQHIRRPDAAFIMDVDLETCIHRIKQRKSFEDSYVEREHLMKSIHAYRTIGTEFDLHLLNSSEYDIEQINDHVNRTVLTLQVGY